MHLVMREFTFSNDMLYRRASTSITGAKCPTCSESKTTAYDSNNLVVSRTDYNDNRTCYANDSTRGLELIRVEGFASSVTTCPSLSTYTPASGTAERKISTTWHSTLRVPTQVVEKGRTTAYTHDSNGNVLTRTVTDTTVTPNVSRTWTYTYNSYGQVLTENGPRTDVSDVTTYTYYSCATGYECGQINTITNAAAQVTTFNTYNAQGYPTQITDQDGVVSQLAYDLRQRPYRSLRERKFADLFEW